MDDGFQRAEAQSERGPRRAARHLMDEAVISGVTGAGKVVEVGGSRLSWWRQRRRLRRKYGVVATRVSATDWRLHREV